MDKTKKILLALIFGIFFLNLISSAVVSSVSTDKLYVDRNISYPVVLLPLDNNVWDIYLYTNGSAYQFNWTGTQYQLYLLFTEVGDYPFRINSTNVSGEINGTFLVRNPYYITFRLYKDKTSIIPFVSNKYINNFAYITAETIDAKTFATNNYNPTLEKYIYPLIDSRFKKPVFYGQYIDGKAMVKLYDAGNYAFRLIDGQITFPYSYSVPNITKSYGANIYIGKYAFNGSNQEYSVYVSSSDIHPYRSLANWVFIIFVIGVVVVSIFLFFMLPQYPSFPILFGIGFIIMAIFLRVILFIWGGT